MILDSAPDDIDQTVDACPACGAARLTSILEVRNVPVNVGIQWPSAEAARDCPRGDIRLVACADCGLISNSVFDPSLLDYGEAYDNSLAASSVFVSYADELAQRLVRQHGLHEKTILEIGCGRGEFLNMLCSIGDNRGIGFDTARLDGIDNPRLTIIPEHYGESHRTYQADLVVCRQVLEHIHHPAEFVRMLRSNLGNSPDKVVFFEVPSADMLLVRLSIWDIIYEHCNYFDRISLQALFEQSGFHVEAVTDEFDGQFLGIEARPSSSPLKPRLSAVEPLFKKSIEFGKQFHVQRSHWKSNLEGIRDAGKRIAVWGAGARAVSFMNMFDLGDCIELLVDINPSKQGTYLPGTGHRTFAPEALIDVPPDVVIIMNSIYRSEIESQLKTMDLTPEILTVQEPKPEVTT